MAEATYELWDVETGNAVGFFATGNQSLRVVRLLLDSFGHAYADDPTLSRRDEGGSSRLVATGNRLADMLRRGTADRVAAGEAPAGCGYASPARSPRP